MNRLLIRSVLLWSIALAVAGGAYCQITVVANDPSGACTPGVNRQVNATTGQFSDCIASTWTKTKASIGAQFATPVNIDPVGPCAYPPLGFVAVNVITAAITTCINGTWSTGPATLVNFPMIPGVVTMTHSLASNPSVWTVTLNDGTTLNTSSSTTQGLQEAITYAQANGFPLWVLGGSIQGGADRTAIVCTTPISIPTGWKMAYHFWAVDLEYTGPAGSDFISIDSSDITEIDFHETQIIYPGTAAAIHFNPVHDNGETFAGFTTSKFTFGTVVCVVSNANFAPDATKGTGVRISAPALGLGLANGNGVFVNNQIYVNEINACSIGLQVDNPGGGTSVMDYNQISSPAIHGQGNTSVLVGTSSINNLIFGNQWKLNIPAANPSNAALSVWGGGTAAGGDIYEVQINAPTGILLNSSAAGNLFISSFSNSTTRYTNNATNQTNKILDSSRGGQVAAITVGGSPFTYTNKDMVTETVAITGGTVSSVQVAGDCSSYSTVAAATGTQITLIPGACAIVTYSSLPTMQKSF